ncbi:hypothetical protein CTER_2715 [Ruminiclostridium cellobioparum subsp. termitidis CT1112]|uniref:Uncharacterized protein n=2 Tax=Ruminiclostridium cellobioparum TaxID=29355 RepID=S0FSF4_RUMCE|nr:hypothetical protein CTER_2715 [Ruminiclostridium cellobioparum subsp. termitidis CT1112]
MENFNILENNAIQLPNGVFAGVESYSCYAGGELEGIRLCEKNILLTHAGELIPAYAETHRRKSKYSVEFYKNGMIKAVALNDQQEIQTPIGEFPAELVTFYETGELKRFFPLDGKFSGMWTEEEEKSLAIPFSFELPFASFKAIISGTGFYQDGSIRSITLFPGERIHITTAYGAIPVRNGFSLYETGELKSLEPAEPAMIQTPVGMLAAFDPNAVGINADQNSLVFDISGRVTALTIVYNRLAVQTGDGRMVTFSPHETVNPLDGETFITEGLRLAFDYDAGTVTIIDGRSETFFRVSDCAFTVLAYSGTVRTCNPTDCAACSNICGNPTK